MKPFRWAAFGATATGKTAWVVQQLQKLKPRRLMVWDPKHDDMLNGMGEPFTDWAAFVRACRGKAFKARYLMNHDFNQHEQFARFCELAWREGNVVLFVDELAEVTKASHAPAAWKKIVNVGRRYENGTKSISIIGASQTPTEVDKSFLNNCDLIHTGRLGNVAAAKTFAQQWGINVTEITGLQPLQWLEKRDTSPDISRGMLKFSGRQQAPKRAP